MIRRALYLLLLVAAIVAGVPYLPASLFRPSITRALERGLGREVEVGEVHLSLLGMPGFKIDDVTIHEDPRAGIEPFAYVQSLGADVDLLSLFSRRLSFSTIRLGDASINVVKSQAGPWNFQYLLSNSAAASGPVPSLKMRGGRVNFKFGDTKSVFYFDDADLALTPNSGGSIEIRFGGAPSRTDRPAQSFGHFFITGNWFPGENQKLDLNVELEPSSLEEVLRVADSRVYGVHGFVAMNAKVSGPTSHLGIAGEVQLDDVHRWDLLPNGGQKGGGWRQPYKGTLDLPAEKLELATVSPMPDPPLSFALQASHYLTTPEWKASAAIHEIPLATLVSLARHIGAPFPDKLTAEGPVSGVLEYAPSGVSGDLKVEGAVLRLPDAPSLRASLLHVALKDSVARLDPATLEVGDAPEVEPSKAQVEASYNAGELDLKLTTRGLSVADTRLFGLKAIPLLEHTPQGTWRGSAHYHAGNWTGDYELQNAKVNVDGLAEPLLIQSMAVSLTPARASASRIKAKVGAIPFTGDYRWEPEAARPHKFRLQIISADLSELARVFAPALGRQQGLLETLRLGNAELPAWLKDRRAEGTLSVNALSASGKTVQITKSRVTWDEGKVHLDELVGTLEDSPLSGSLLISLDGRVPQYHFQGKLTEVPYKDGELDFDGMLDAEGSGPALLSSLRAEGSLKGRDVSFVPDVAFRALSGRFEFRKLAWKLSSLEINPGPDALTGSGATQPDGSILLDLATRGKPVRYMGTVPGHER
jgi:AsmA family